MNEISPAIQKFVGWMQTNGIQQKPQIGPQKDFTPVEGFKPSIEIEWQGTAGRVQFYLDEIEHWVEDNNAANLQGVVLEPVQRLLGVPVGLVQSWQDFISPPAPAGINHGVVGAQIPDATVAQFANPDRPLIILGRKYFELLGPYPAEGAKYSAPDGSVYTVVAPNPFKRWLRQ